MDRPTVRIRTAGYENIYFDCPHCLLENIINRASDLAPLATTSGMEVKCQYNNCGGLLWLTSDRVQIAKYHWFLQELPELKQRKLYRDYALTLCQGAESFFLQAIINKKFDRDLKFRNTTGRIIINDYLNNCKQYEEEIKTYTFNKMRSIFLDTFKDERDNPTARIKHLKEDRREWAFTTIKTSKINSLRNNVAHKNAYRPTLLEIESHNDLVIALYWLGTYLNVVESSYARNKQLDQL